jgi:hypothetical protein
MLKNDMLSLQLSKRVRALSHDPLGGQLEDSWKKQWVALGSADTWRVLV